jgi:hypothetical protein
MKLSRPSIVTGLRWLVFPMLCARLSAATMTFAAVADTSLFQANPNGDLGGTSLVAGTTFNDSRSRALFRFDLGALPPGAVVSGAEVSLYVSRVPDPDMRGAPVSFDFSLHRLLVSWGEGTGALVTGTVAMPGDATWNERHFGSTAWASPGALIGVDYVEAASATTAVVDVGGYVWSSGGLVDDVKAWQENPASNFGFILASEDETTQGSGRRFGSSEQLGGAVTPPRLTVAYTLVPEPGSAGLWLLGLAVLALRRVRRD